jgi:hypothetical protein
MPKNAEKYICNECDFKCSKRSNYTKHLATAKHKLMTNDDKISDKNAENAAAYICICGKSYKHRQGLSLHKKTCSYKTSKNAENAEFAIFDNCLSSLENSVVDENPSEAIIMKCFQMMQETQAAQAAAAQEQTRQLVEAISLKESQIITNNTTNNNTNNNQFNLNVFLNEDCKDAYTLKEVINSIECTVTDLDRMDKDGYAATVVRKIMESIQDMSITERPIHCTDARRNTVCVKSETGWERNEAAMQSLNNSVYKVGRLLGNVVDDWRDTYPDHFRGSDYRREQYHRLITDILKVSDGDIEARIASKVCKGIILDRKAVMESK